MKIGSNIMIYEKQKLGEGSYGSVFKCSDENGNTYAVKCIKMNDTGIPNILENSIMMTISHPHLNTALKIHTDAEKLYIFQNLAKTDLAKYTRKQMKREDNKQQLVSKKLPFNSHITPALLKKWSYSLVQAIACLHRQKIIHADVKANNVLLFEDQEVKLGDFTLAVKVWNQAYTTGGGKKDSAESLSADDADKSSIFYHRVCTYSHRPPECWFRKGWSFPLDIWSLGCTLFEIAYGRLLFPSQGKITDKESKTMVYKKAVNCLLDWAKNGPNASSSPKWIDAFRMHQGIDYKKATLPSSFSNPEYREFNKLILWMLKIDPLQRPTIDEILRHEYFENLTSLPYTIKSTAPKIINRKEQQRLAKYLDRYVDNFQVKNLSVELYGRCNSLKGISEQLKIATCVWIAEKLVRIRPKENGLPRSLIHKSERRICQHLSFRLHTSVSEN